jgi:hypothetical protein
MNLLLKSTKAEETNICIERGELDILEGGECMIEIKEFLIPVMRE